MASFGQHKIYLEPKARPFSLGSTTPFILSSTAARAGSISARSRGASVHALLPQNAHYVGSGPPSLDQFSHDSEVWGHVVEDLLVSLAEIAQSRPALRGFCKSVFGAVTMASSSNFTHLAALGQAVQFRTPEPSLGHRRHEFR